MLRALEKGKHLNFGAGVLSIDKLALGGEPNLAP